MTVPSNSRMASSSASQAQMSRWLVGSSRISTFAPSTTSLARAARLRSPPLSSLTGCSTILPGKPEAAEQVAHLLLGELGVRFRPDGLQHRFVLVGRSFRC